MFRKCSRGGYNNHIVAPLLIVLCHDQATIVNTGLEMGPLWLQLLPARSAPAPCNLAAVASMGGSVLKSQIICMLPH